MTDRREEFSDVAWQQGRLLDTQITRRWSQAARERGKEIVKRIAYAHFSALDEGRTRVLLYVFNSAAECAQAVAFHNCQLAKQGAEL